MRIILNKKLLFSRLENLTLLGTEREFRLGDAGDISLSFFFCLKFVVSFFFLILLELSLTAPK